MEIASKLSSVYDIDEVGGTIGVGGPTGNYVNE
jgi:hypothetical protein